jgi:hypothetical protein
MNTIVSCVQQGTGYHYHVTYSQPTTLIAPGVENGVVMFSPSGPGWNAAYAHSQVSSNTIDYEDSNQDTDCTLLVIVGPLTNATSADPIGPQPPQVTIT